VSGRRLAGVVGHDALRARFEELLATGRLAPAYLFVGPAGVGKRTFALALARAGLCRAGGGDACACTSCQKVRARTHPDLHVYSAEGEVFPIDHVRELRARLAQVPWESDHRYAILDGVERLAAEAGNALLKTLEEPPAYARIVLVIAGSGTLLPTIESRCQRVRFGPLGEADVAAGLVASGMDSARARALAPLCGGRLGAATAEGEALLAARERLLAEWAKGLSLVGAGAALGVVALGDAEGQAAREVARGLLDFLEVVLRDRIAELSGAGAPLAADVPTELRATLGHDIEKLLASAEQVADWRLAIRSNVSPKAVLEDAGRVIAGCP